MLIFRYLAKEVFVTLVALIVILLLIFMSNQLVQYLNRAVMGQFPAAFILKLMLLEVPNLMTLLLPLGFYVSLILAFGRLYAESEMTVLAACGYGPNQLLKHSFIMAMFVALFVAVTVFLGGPYIATERAKLIKSSGLQTLIQTIAPKQFYSLAGGRQVFYVESMEPNHKQAEHLFFAKYNLKQGQKQWDILWADSAEAYRDPKTGEHFVELHQGMDYQGVPGNANYQVASFERLRARLPHPIRDFKHDMRTTATSELWPMNNTNKAKAAEFQWRISVPLMVLTLTLVAVPLSRVNPRSGKFSKLFPAILIYIVYANFMFISRNWIASGKVPVWIGMWWLHVMIAGIGLSLIVHQRIKRL